MFVDICVDMCVDVCVDMCAPPAGTALFTAATESCSTTYCARLLANKVGVVVTSTVLFSICTSPDVCPHLWMPEFFYLAFASRQ